MDKVKIEKLVFGGQGMGRIENKVAFIWGAIPGEEVEFQVIRKKKNFIEGIAKNILTPSPCRTEPKDDHYLSCSPWQSISYEEENKWKVEIAAETYAKFAGFRDLNLQIGAPEKAYEYRNKLEYNFTKNRLGQVSLAFHFRGTHNLRPIDFCALGDEAVKKASEEIISEIRKGGVPLSALKSLIVRSDSKGNSAAALFVTDREYLKKYYIPNPNNVKGFQIYYSNPLSPASVPTELLLTNGETELETEINGVRLRFGLLSFFQINPPIFEEALKDIKLHLGNERIIDYYSGVGAISLPLHNSFSEAVLIEENAEAIDFAVENIALNGFTNVAVKNALAEDTDIEINKKDVVILDPPRTGLHKDMVNQLLKKEPKKIIYLSCGLDTHARDIQMLSTKYKPVFWKLYNFFPRTPHIEGLCVLERIGN